jgi:hypothetical protein
MAMTKLKTPIAIIVVLLSSLAFSKAKENKEVSQDRIELQTEYGLVLLQNVSLQQARDEIVVTGTVTNHSSRAWRSIGFILNLRDKNGRELKSELDTPLDREVSVSDLGKGETKALGGLTGEVPAKLTLYGLHGKVDSFDLQWSKEYSYYDSHTVFALTQPAPNKKLFFEDDAIAIGFDVANEQLQFILGNKTQEPQTINWDEVSFIDLSGTAHRVLHAGVKLEDRDKPQSPTVIPPGAKINDLVAPSDFVRLNTTINEWVHDPLLPPSQRIVNYKGQTFGVFMPIVVNGKKKNYTFTIRIEDVEM